MSVKRILLAGGAAFVVMFVLGGIWNALIMTDQYADHAPVNVRSPEDASMLFLIVGYLLLTCFMTFLFSQSFSERPSTGQGFQFGALFGIIATLPLYMILYAVWDISIVHILIDSGWHLVEQGIGGIVLGLVMFPATGVAPARAASSG